LNPTADLAAKLHRANLHHRDLYLCHFFAKASGDTVDLKLIDVARVSRLGTWFRGRWIIKDLAQFWYSTLSVPVTDSQREQWLQRYIGQSNGQLLQLKSRVQRKARSTHRRDLELRESQPHRNISIPSN